MAFAQPLDLYYHLVTTFSGNLGLFTAIMFLVIGSMAAMFRMPTIVFGLSFALFVVLLAAYLQVLFALILILGGLAIFWVIARLFKT